MRRTRRRIEEGIKKPYLDGDVDVGHEVLLTSIIPCHTLGHDT